MRIPPNVSQYLLEHKTKPNSELVIDLYEKFGLSVSAQTISKHLCYKGAKVSKRSETFMEIPDEIKDEYPNHYIVLRNGVWVIRAKRGNVSGYTCTLLSKALLEKRYGITISPRTMVIHINGDTSDMSDDNIVAVPHSVYNRATKRADNNFAEASADRRRLLIALAWSEHLNYLSQQILETNRDDVRSKTAGQIQSDAALYSISQRPLRISGSVVQVG